MKNILKLTINNDKPIIVNLQNKQKNQLCNIVDYNQ